MDDFGAGATIVGEFTDLETVLAPYGVGVEAFEAYVIEAVRRLRGEDVSGG